MRKLFDQFKHQHSIPIRQFSDLCGNQAALVVCSGAGCDQKISNRAVKNFCQFNQANNSWNHRASFDTGYSFIADTQAFSNLFLG